MKTRLSPWNLGATLYMPATRTDILPAILANSIPGLRSLVICLEDAVSESDVQLACDNLKALCTQLAQAKASEGNARWPLVFVRPRHREMAQWMQSNVDLTPLDGLVLAKFNQASLDPWWQHLQHTHLCMMPTLETEDVFDVQRMHALAGALAEHPCRERIIALRIGGNDLMNMLSLRRPRHLTLYDGPMGYVINMLVCTFSPKGFSLAAPVCEHIDDNTILQRELLLDIAYGLVGKTAIHPGQIALIQQALMVCATEHADALRILGSSQAVFKSQGAMCEPATHKHWASAIIARAQYYGLRNDDGGENAHFS